jgi:hypothetical protein
LATSDDKGGPAPIGREHIEQCARWVAALSDPLLQAAAQDWVYQQSVIG